MVNILIQTYRSYLNNLIIVCAIQILQLECLLLRILTLSYYNEPMPYKNTPLFDIHGRAFWQLLR